MLTSRFSCLFLLPPLQLLTNSRLYMADGLYQSLICFYMPYLLYQPANFVTANGLNTNERTRMGILVACAAVVASNTYILLNTYRWDWLTVLINAISSLLIFAWTGIYSCFTASGMFYHSGTEVYGSLSFWVVFLITVVICLLPRFAIKSVQKVFFPYDVDIVREWVTQGKFKYLEQHETYVPPPAAPPGGLGDDSATSSDLGKPIEPSMKQNPFSDDHQAVYPPSVTRTTHTHNTRSQNGSNGTNYTDSLDQRPHPQPVDYGNSNEQTRHSFDGDLPSYEATNDFSKMGAQIHPTPHDTSKVHHNPPLNVF